MNEKLNKLINNDLGMTGLEIEEAILMEESEVNPILDEIKNNPVLSKEIVNAAPIDGDVLVHSLEIEEKEQYVMLLTTDAPNYDPLYLIVQDSTDGEFVSVKAY